MPFQGFESQVQSEGDMSFSSEGQDLYRELMTKQAYLQRDPEEGEYQRTLKNGLLTVGSNTKFLHALLA
jgi:hypothetical protein